VAQTSDKSSHSLAGRKFQFIPFRVHPHRFEEREPGFPRFQ
jgi:hypothetical protein